MRSSAAVLLTLTLAAFDASGATLYRWVTEDGRVEIGTTPPPGVNAVPWTPGPPEAAAPAPPPPAPADPVRPGPNTAKSDRCLRLEEEARELRSSIVEKEAEIEALEASAARLAATEVAYQRVDCRDDVYGANTDCEPLVFDRDREIERADEKLAQARDELDDLEQRAGSIALSDCDEAEAR
jgi:type IV secretory pathway VirB10-like protein